MQLNMKLYITAEDKLLKVEVPKALLKNIMIRQQVSLAGGGASSLLGAAGVLAGGGSMYLEIYKAVM